MGNYLEEQKRLAGVKGNLEETISSMHENREIRKASSLMGRALVKALAKKGMKAEKASTDGWGSTGVLVESPHGKYVAQLTVQDAMRGQQIGIQFQDPMFKDREHDSEIFRTMGGVNMAFMKLAHKFSQFGTSKHNQNDRGWPQVWVEVDEDKWKDALDKVPSMMGPVAAAIVAGFKR